MSNPETRIEQAFARWCSRNGHRCVKLIAAGQSGFPDRTVFTSDGRIVFLEFKQPDGRLSKQQVQWAAFLGRHWPMFVVTSVEEAKEAITGQG